MTTACSFPSRVQRLPPCSSQASCKARYRDAELTHLNGPPASSLLTLLPPSFQLLLAARDSEPAGVWWWTGRAGTDVGHGRSLACSLCPSHSPHLLLLWPRIGRARPPGLRDQLGGRPEMEGSRGIDWSSSYLQRLKLFTKSAEVHLLHKASFI